MLQGNLGYFPYCQTIKTQISTTMFPCAQSAEKLGAEFTRRFADFDVQKCRFELLRNPFAVDVENAPTNLQKELIELQCSDTLKSKYDAVGAAQFPHLIPDTMPQLHTQAVQMLSMFGSTYLCEQLFSSMKMTKTSHRSRLTDEDLCSILRISSAQSLSPDIDELASKKRCQVGVLSRYFAVYESRELGMFLYRSSTPEADAEPVVAARFLRVGVVLRDPAALPSSLLCPFSSSLTWSGSRGSAFFRAFISSFSSDTHCIKASRRLSTSTWPPSAGPTVPPSTTITPLLLSLLGLCRYEPGQDARRLDLTLWYQMAARLMPAIPASAPRTITLLSACAMLSAAECNVNLSRGWSGPSLDGRPVGAGRGVGGPVGGAHPSGLSPMPRDGDGDSVPSRAPSFG
ncbi:General transcription factor II-I repeat domain-containing protein 2 [Merluccius polli]|uniref:General transcription factor II-I repeat domain-containing protein 2 n=1 Tax=Merluccius polli TaxID=89951 RepID=A0AA47MC78_MERPO|nr:General transcription factor II-I repeat domain-containing protein 2 [Merluccius polli]